MAFRMFFQNFFTHHIGSEGFSISDSIFHIFGNLRVFLVAVFIIVLDILFQLCLVGLLLPSALCQ